ncbi:hypothetical protein GCM10011374_24420 [Kocuria dechangensis]|uniref:Uncharacterized protein n=1 Tax=Kocuria dechangensis TaxID=1176249 RepID=A0A917GY08_9MICC|nr:hypothetical protein [Kocuria dechangensis]GGG60665.1 hypothetical protein GCM10011374_24420 [Kocuria dechangensis]
MDQGLPELPDHHHPATPVTGCPTWCVTAHGTHTGEEDWLHLGEPLAITGEGTTARLCLSIDPGTGAVDGPYVLIGSSEYTPTAVVALSQALFALAAAATPHGTDQELPWMA